MAVSLVSTGIQFPDSTIQTTAATAGAAGAMVFISNTTASAAANVDITGFDSTYNTYVIECANFSTNTSIVLAARFFASGSIHSGNYVTNGVSTTSTTGSNGTYMEPCFDRNFSGGISAPFRITIQRNPDNTKHQAVFDVSFNNSGTYSGARTVGMNETSITLSGIRFYDRYSFTSSLSGTFKLYGIKLS